MSNVRPGDLAVVVKCKNAPENIGAIRRVIADAGMWFEAWALQPPLPNGDDAACDSCLRPIRDPGEDAVDEMLQLLGQPEATPIEFALQVER